MIHPPCLLGGPCHAFRYTTEPSDWAELAAWRRQLRHAHAYSRAHAHGHANTLGHGHGPQESPQEYPQERRAVVRGFKCPKVVYDIRWVHALLAINPRTRFVITLRRPSDWLLSFYR